MTFVVYVFVVYVFVVYSFVVNVATGGINLLLEA